MTVRELIKRLNNFNLDLEVYTVNHDSSVNHAEYYEPDPMLLKRNFKEPWMKDETGKRAIVL